jgi:hypothetical protein
LKGFKSADINQYVLLSEFGSPDPLHSPLFVIEGTRKKSFPTFEPFNNINHGCRDRIDHWVSRLDLEHSWVSLKANMEAAPRFGAGMTPL